MVKNMKYSKLSILALALFLTFDSSAATFTRLLPKNLALNVQHPNTAAFSITITNDSDKSFTFRNFDLDCKCIKFINAKLNKKPVKPKNLSVKPNDILTLDFKFFSKYYTKPKTLPLFFYFNNVIPAVQVVKIIANVKSEIIAQPEALSTVVPFGFVGKIGEFSLKNNKNINILSVSSESDFIKATINSNIFNINVSLVKPIINNTSAWLNVKLDDKNQKNLNLHIREIKFIPDIKKSPAIMNFGIIQTNGLIVGKEIVLTSRTKTPWKVIGTQITGRNKNAIKCKILPQTNSTVNVVWAILDGKIKPGLLKSEIIINTDHPFTKKIIIPVKGQVIASNKNKKVKK